MATTQSLLYNSKNLLQVLRTHYELTGTEGKNCLGINCSVLHLENGPKNMSFLGEKIKQNSFFALNA